MHCCCMIEEKIHTLKQVLSHAGRMWAPYMICAGYEGKVCIFQVTPDQINAGVPASLVRM